MIRPSVHGRGRRPFVFAGACHDDVPGAKVSTHGVQCALDAAWIFDRLGLSFVSGAPAPEAPYVLPHGLYPYQAEGMRFLASRDYALLSDEMGLGKTVQALLAAEWRLSGSVPGGQPAVLILCPALAKRHWAREVKRWIGVDAVILDGMRPGPLPRARYIIANYDILYGARKRTAAGKLEARAGLDGWGSVLGAARIPIVICDEAHVLRGGPDSRRGKAVKQLAKHSTCVWLLTGTPMPNHVRDLWGLWDLASDGLAGGYWPWVRRYAGAYKGQYGMVDTGSSNLDELQARLSFWVLGRSKAQVGLQLPEKRREIAPVDTSAAPVTYEIRPDDTKTNAVARALRETAAAKRPAVVQMSVDAANGGQKVVVFVYMRETADRIGAELKAKLTCPIYAVSGDMSPEGRDVTAQQFRETPGAAVFVATIDSVGVAISLVGADLVIFGDLSWEPYKLLQAEGRAHRHGSKNRVLVRYVIAAGTIDEAVKEAVIDKLATMEEALGRIDDAAELSTQLGGQRGGTEAIVDRLFARLTGG